MKQHKYLEDNGISRSEIVENLCEENGSEPRSHQWRLERKIYGFDNRETWNMDSAFAMWLMERLLMYKDVSIVDLSFYTSNYKGKKITQEEAIDIMISECKQYLTLDSWDEKRAEHWDNLVSLWKDWGMAMWW